MFEPSDGPRVFGIAPGADFPKLVVDGILERLAGAPPEDLARVRVFANTRRMQRRLKTIFSGAGATLLPCIGLVTELDHLVLDESLPPAIPPLRRRMEIASLIAALLDANPDLAPRSALFDLADSLAALLDEMQGEGVDPDTIINMDVGDQSGHWARSQAFIRIVTQYLASSGTEELDPEARRRAAVQILRDKWTISPPRDPVLVVGSTGSRGTTSMLMETVARLPQGALILPGFDTEMRPAVWKDILSGSGQEDHPQYRFADLLRRLELKSGDVIPWIKHGSRSLRNRLISLSLRPAPVTHQWLTDGPQLGDLLEATSDISLLEAPNQRVEAAAIGIAMRDAVERGERVALVTPDRLLGRRVTAFLSRWDIVPDDSAGRPLAQTAPGRLLRQVSRLIGQQVTSEDLIALLRHPLTYSDGTSRGQHLLNTQELELFLRKNSIATPSRGWLDKFADTDPQREDWINWICKLLDDLNRAPGHTVPDILKAIVTHGEALARGPMPEGTGELWEKAPGRDTHAAIGALLDQTENGPKVTKEDVSRLLDRVLQSENTRVSDYSRSDVMIWGTLEARVQGADVMILAGLNEGTWPGRPAPDPWLNRQMRDAAGMLLPERQIGLSAHDYQQAVAAKRVVLSRSLRDDQAETVASRWINRMTNLLSGLPAQRGDVALENMRARGKRLIAQAEAIDSPEHKTTRSERPAPVPPPPLRPKILSVTEVETLIRDPYAVYCKHVLRLRALNALRPLPDAAMRGSVFHAIVDRLIGAGPFLKEDDLIAALRAISEEILEKYVPWPAVRRHWQGHIDAITAPFAKAEMERQSQGSTVGREVWGELQLSDDGLGVKGKADRIDRLLGGGLVIYDYKSGSPPTAAVIRHFQRQLPIEAVMAEAGAFEGIPAETVDFVSHIGLNRKTETDRHEMNQTSERDFRTVTIHEELRELLSRFQEPEKGFPSRRAKETVRWGGDYDHLARFGEWSDTEPAQDIPLR